MKYSSDIHNLMEEFANDLKKQMKVHFDRVVRIKEVLEIVGVSRSVLEELVRHGQFPQPIQISRTLHGWRMSDVQEFIRIGGVDAWMQQYGKTNNVRLAA